MSEQRYYIPESMAETLRDVIARVRGMKISGPGVDFTNTNAGIACTFDVQGFARGVAGLFPVKVEKTGGTNGTNTTAASYTYTVRSIGWNGTDGGTTLGTGVAVSRPRMNGAVTFQAGSTGYGVAFMDGSTLVLWDAGEKLNTAGCS